MLIGIGAIALLAIGVGAWAFWETWKVYTAEPKPTGAPLHAFRAYSEKIAGVEPGAGLEAWALLEEILAKSERLHAAYEEELIESHGSPIIHARYVPAYSLINDAVEVADMSGVEMELEMIQRLRETGLFDDLNRFATMGPAFPAMDPDVRLFESVMAKLGSERQLIKARIATLRLAIEEKRWDDADHALTQTLAVTRAIVNQPGIAPVLRAFASYALVSREIQISIMEHRLPADVRRTMMVRLDDFRPPSIEYVMRSEFAMQLHIFEHIFVGSGDDRYLSPHGLMMAGGRSFDGHSLRDAFFSRFGIASASETIAMLDDWLELQRAYFASENEDDGRNIAARIEQLQRNLPSRYMLLDLYLPAISKALQNVQSTHMQYEATRLMLLLEAYRNVHDTYPESLTALEASTGENLPRDPVSRASFGYRLLQEDPHGRPYLLYSFGLDGVDDGGALPEDRYDAWAAITSEERSAGYDFVVNRPRPGLSENMEE